MAAQISSIRGLVTVGDDNEILKQRDPITANGGLLKISDFVEILFDDGRVVTIDGPAEFVLDSSFFQVSRFDESMTQITDLANLNTTIDVIENKTLEDTSFNETLGGTNGLNIIDGVNDLIIKGDIDKELNDAEGTANALNETTATPVTRTATIAVTPEETITEELVQTEEETITETITTRDLNEVMSLSVTPIDTIIENSVDLNTVIAKSSAIDPDGSNILYSITSGNEDGYYLINTNTGTITLTQKGVDYVNTGNNLPSFNVNARSTSGEVSSDSVTIDMVNTTTVNDAMLGFEMNSVNNFTEHATAAGDIDGSSQSVSDLDPSVTSVNDAMLGFEMNSVNNFTEDGTSAGDIVTRWFKPKCI